MIMPISRSDGGATVTRNDFHSFATAAGFDNGTAGRVEEVTE
jgi:hypothetical protein